MRLEKGTLHRRLTCYREREAILVGQKAATEADRSVLSPFPLEEPARIARVYGVEPGTGAKKHRFAGRFTGRTPGDIGGSGSFLETGNPLGERQERLHVPVKLFKE